jgi:hypothetical protein
MLITVILFTNIATVGSFEIICSRCKEVGLYMCAGGNCVQKGIATSPQPAD